MVIEQKIYEGRHNLAAELGHFIVKPGGEVCSCGRRGCLETRVSYQALQRIHPFAVADFGKALAQYTELSEPLDLFARSIVNSATMIAPDRIVLTGELFADETVRTRLIALCKSYDDSFGEQRILYSPLSNRADYVGAVATCAKHLLFT